MRRNGDGVAVGEDGIAPVAGQRRKIYATTSTMPYDTSICGGSAPVAGA